MTVEKLLVRLGSFVALAYLLIGIFAELLIRSSGLGELSARAEILLMVFFVGGAALLLGGLRTSRRSPWTGAGMISVGALAGAFPLHWSVVAPLLAIALVVLSILYARRSSAAGVAATPD